MFGNNNNLAAGYCDENHTDNNLKQTNYPAPFNPSESTNTNFKNSKNPNNDLLIDPSQTLSKSVKELNRQRVSLLLEINAILLQKCIELQNTQNAEKDHFGTSKSIMTGCIQRLQTNLSYLAAVADKSYKNEGNYICNNPIIFSPPSNIHSLIEPYERLKSLFFIKKSPPISSVKYLSTQSLKNTNFYPTKQNIGNPSNSKSNTNTFPEEHQNNNINTYDQVQQIQNPSTSAIQQPASLPSSQSSLSQEFIVPKHSIQLVQNTNNYIQHIQPSFQQANFLNLKQNKI